MNNLPDGYHLYQAIKDTLEYEFERWYGVSFYNADNKQRVDFSSIVSEYLTEILKDCLEDD